MWMVLPGVGEAWEDATQPLESPSRVYDLLFADQTYTL